MNKKIRVLVVDDSGYVIAAVSHRLNADPDIEVIGSARNGIEAIEKVKSLQPDVVTLDVIMPEMDGITALQKIMAECPTPVVMLSALTSEHAETTIRALELGAVDFFLKPSAIKPASDDTLAAKVKTAAVSNIHKHGQPISNFTSLKKKTTVENNAPFHKLVVIGASTGGPKSLMQVVPLLPGDLPAAVLVVQHMPPVFTRSLAERLNQASQLTVEEAIEGSIVGRGRVLVAPGDFHMLIEKNGRIALNQEPTVNGVRPSVDVTMKSAAKCGVPLVGVVLTGMGVDGTDGCSHFKTVGARILVQDEATCAVYGMPASVVKAGYADAILPLHKIAEGIVEACAN